jgi:K+-sensing histidine kinase KdpD
MTHEFKTPISSISLAAQMLNDKSIKKSESMYDNLSRVINDETKRLRFQVEKVLQMSLYDRDNIAFKQKELDAHRLLAGVIKTFTLKVTQNGGTIKSDFEALLSEIYVDEMHFTNVIFNLFDNALKYAYEGRPLKLHIETRAKNGKLEIEIEDNGITNGKEIYYYPDYHNKDNRLEFNSLSGFSDFCEENGYNVPDHIATDIMYRRVSHVCLRPDAREYGLYEIMAEESYGSMFYEVCEASELGG